MPFCYGEYDTVWCCTIPFSVQYAANSTKVNLLPRSVRSTRSFLPLSASMHTLNFLTASVALVLLVRSYSHMYRL